MLFKNRSFNVKVVRDENTSDEPIDPMRGVLVAEAYSALAIATTWELVKPIVFVIAVKGAFDVAKIAARGRLYK